MGSLGDDKNKHKLNKSYDTPSALQWGEAC